MPISDPATMRTSLAYRVLTGGQLRNTVSVATEYGCRFPVDATDGTALIWTRGDFILRCNLAETVDPYIYFSLIVWLEIHIEFITTRIPAGV